MAGVAINLCEKALFFCSFCLVYKTNKRIPHDTDMFVWRLDCRLKYVWYLLLTKFMIFGYFGGKICLFLESLWRALQITSVKVFHLLFIFLIFHQKITRRWKIDREVCVTVGLSSEVCLVPKRDKICDFWLFFG